MEPFFGEEGRNLLRKVEGSFLYHVGVALVLRVAHNQATMLLGWEVVCV